jgi:LmbE family N-acetylglucosaminyl deacetylase
VGWFGPEEQNPGPERLGQLREKELSNAVKELGMKSLHFLDYIDGSVDKAVHTEAIGKIVTYIRRIKPQVVVTFPPDGNYGHPDHIAVGQFTSAAIVCAADSSCQDAENLPAHRVSKLYYMVDGENFINLIAPFMGDMTFPVDDQVRGEIAWKEWMVTTRIEMSAALQCCLESHSMSSEPIANPGCALRNGCRCRSIRSCHAGHVLSCIQFGQRRQGN